MDEWSDERPGEAGPADGRGLEQSGERGVGDALAAPPAGLGTPPGIEPGAADDLMRRVQRGEVEVLALLFDRYSAPLFNFYLRMTGERAASEDLVQEVFFRILKYRHTYQPGTRFVPWMYQIARNARLDYYRKRKQEVALEDEFEVMAAQPEPGIEREQQELLLRRALLLLPADKREVLVLARFQQLRYEQIAAVLGCGAGAVKVRVFRAMQELKEIFLDLTRRPGGRRPV